MPPPNNKTRNRRRLMADCNLRALLRSVEWALKEAHVQLGDAPFPGEDILVIIREVRSDPELFGQGAALVFDELSREFEQEIFDATPKQ